MRLLITGLLMLAFGLFVRFGLGEFDEQADRYAADESTADRMKRFHRASGVWIVRLGWSFVVAGVAWEGEAWLRG